jgi:hypothetical protein
MGTCLPITAAVSCLRVCLPGAAPDIGGLTSRMEIRLDGFRDRFGFPDTTAAILLPDGTNPTVSTAMADLATDAPR